MITIIAGAVDIQIPGIGRVWCPPAYMAGFVGRPVVKTPATIDRPYWTQGVKCKHQQCGPELSNDEIEENVKPELIAVSALCQALQASREYLLQQPMPSSPLKH